VPTSSRGVKDVYRKTSLDAGKIGWDAPAQDIVLSAWEREEGNKERKKR
jgi:hypothetical protein